MGNGNGKLRDQILLAVNRVVARGGLVNTTIDAVAAEAGVSKGGVLYYFPSKRELLLGMIDLYITEFYRRREEVLAKLPDNACRKLKATIMVMLADMDATRDEIPNFATVLDDADVRKKVGEFKKAIYKDISKGVSKAESVPLIMYIVDGMWMDNRFSPNVVSKSARTAATKELMKYIDSLGE